MSNITEVENPVTGDMILLCKGEVTGVFLNEIPEDKQRTYKGSKPGSTFTPKFRPVIVIGETRLSLGQRENDRIQGKKKGGGDKDYVPVTRGAEVSCIVEKTEYNGKTYYNTAPSKITVIKQGEDTPQGGGGQSNTKQGSGGYSPRDNSGMEAGHCINAAYCLLNYKVSDNEEVVEFAKKLHDITASLKKTYKESHPNMSDYDVGASVGHAVLNACRILTKTKIGEVESYAQSILDEVSTPVLAYIKGEDPTPKAEEETSTETTTDQDDWDDDIPF